MLLSAHYPLSLVIKKSAPWSCDLGAGYRRGVEGGD